MHCGRGRGRLIRLVPQTRQTSAASQPSQWTPSPAYPVSSEIVPYSAPPQSPAVPHYQPAPTPGPYAPFIRPTSGKATASMVFGIIGFFAFCTVVPSIIAVVCGHFALAETRDGDRGGHGQAVAGLILGYLVVVPVLVWYAIMILSAIAG
ncbi:MAG: hypothetical protein QOE51_1572 [Actinoplanes sp.]|nr:hypothetical protein [Actinoplanes sp.]